MVVCSHCGRQNPGDAQFCAGCAAALVAEPEAPRAVRKTVTVLFSDVVDSTPLGERLDPESLRRVMGRWHEVMRGVLEQHGGTVEKFVGDAVMAVFGVPLVHEDDALRAVRAAAEMRVALAALNAELKRDYAVQIEVRTALNTGEVVSGQGETLVTGDAVNVAARLEQAAQSGEILIGEQTFRLVRDVALVESVDELALKGKTQPLAARRLLGMLPDVPAFVRPIATPFVGRKRELGLLAAAFERATAGHCELLTILGPPGIGKSRLMREFVATIGDRSQVLIGRCLPYGEGITYWPLVEIVKQIAGAEPQPGLAALLAGDERAELVAEHVAAAVGGLERGGSTDETHWAVRRMFEALARERPLVVVLDDLHWAEPTFLDLVEYVVGFSTGRPILLLASARPELLEAKPAWGIGGPSSRPFLLEPLPESDVEGLIEGLLVARTLPRRLRARAIEASEGNPLFVEQLLAMEAEEVEEELVVPPTLRALLAARIDRLEPGERAVIERAAVEGRGFHRGAVAQLLPSAERGGVGARLLALVRKELIRPDRSEFVGDDGFRFVHILVRDAAYESISKELRAELHERYASWLEGTSGERMREYQEILGYHLEQACTYQAELGPLDDRALELALRGAGMLADAGHRALARTDDVAAANLLSRAAALLPRDHQARLQILPDLGEALGNCGRLGEAKATFAEAIERASVVEDVRVEARARMGRLELARSYPDPREVVDARAEVERAIAVFESVGDNSGLAHALRFLARDDFAHGRLAQGTAALDRALRLARKSEDDYEEARVRGTIGSLSRLGPASADEVSSMHLGLLEAMQGRFERARELVSRGRAVLREISPVFFAESATRLAAVEMLAASPGAAELALRESYEVLGGLSERGLSSRFAAALAQSLYAQSRYDEAEEFSEISEHAAARDDLESQILWRSVRAKILARSGDHESAERVAREAVSWAGETVYVALKADALMDLAEVLQLGERQLEAAPVLEEARRIYEQKGNIVSAGKARAQLRELQPSSRS